MFNSENQALKLPQVNTGDNKSLKDKLKSVDMKIGKRKHAILTSEALNETLKKSSTKVELKKQSKVPKRESASGANRPLK